MKLRDKHDVSCKVCCKFPSTDPQPIRKLKRGLYDFLDEERPSILSDICFKLVLVCEGCKILISFTPRNYFKF